MAARDREASLSAAIPFKRRRSVASRTMATKARYRPPLAQRISMVRGVAAGRRPPLWFCPVASPNSQRKPRDRLIRFRNTSAQLREFVPYHFVVVQPNFDLSAGGFSNK